MRIDSVQALHEFGVSFWQVSVLHTAVHLKVFTHLGADDLDTEEMAKRMGTDPRATEMLLNAVTSLGLLQKKGERFKNSPFAGTHLDETSSDFMGNIVYHYKHMYQNWGKLEEAILSGKPLVKREDRTEEMTRQFLLGMHNLAVRGAQILAPKLDFSTHRTLLDLGGGPGTYSLYFCRHNPGLKATLFDLPGSRETAEKSIRSFGLEDRVTFVAGDYHKDKLPEGPFDVVFMSHILHGSGFDECASLIRSVYPVVKPGGEVIVQEFVLAEDKTEPTFAAMFALNMLIHTPKGRTYTYNEIRGWLEDAGFIRTRQEFYDSLPNEASLVRAYKP